MIDVYESAVDHRGWQGAVFERDDDSAFFYLLDLTRNESNQIVEAFNAHSLTTAPADTSFAVRWNTAEDAVGLFANSALVAPFDLGSEATKGRWATDADTDRFARH